MAWSGFLGRGSGGGMALRERYLPPPEIPKPSVSRSELARATLRWPSASKSRGSVPRTRGPAGDVSEGDRGAPKSADEAEPNWWSLIAQARTQMGAPAAERQGGADPPGQDPLRSAVRTRVRPRTATPRTPVRPQKVGHRLVCMPERGYNLPALIAPSGQSPVVMSSIALVRAMRLGRSSANRAKAATM